MNYHPPDIRDESMGGIYFEVDGGYREAGIEYHYGDKLQPIVEKFIPQPDDSYALVYSLDCADKTSCKVYLKPYIIDNTGKKIYHRNYDGTNFISVGYDLSGTKIANTDEDGVEVNGVKETVASLKQIGINIKRTAGEYKGVYDGGYDAVNDQLTELKSLLDAETYKKLAREIKQLATKIINGNFDIKSYLSKFRADFAELAAVLDTAYSYLGKLTSYDKQYYGSYLSVSSAVTFIGPGKLKGTQALKKIDDKAKEVIEKGRKLEEAAEKQRKIEEATRLAKVIADFKATKWTTGLKKHLFEGEVKGNTKDGYSVSGVHHQSAIRQQQKGVNTTGDIRIKNRVDKGNGFYDADVEGYSSIKYEGGDKNQKGMAEDMKGWIKKEPKSTFFPDNWSQEKIRDEVAVAWGNKKLVTKTIGNETRTGNIGYTTDGYPIEFQINTDQSVKSAYANFFFK